MKGTREKLLIASAVKNISLQSCEDMMLEYHRRISLIFSWIGALTNNASFFSSSTRTVNQFRIHSNEIIQLKRSIPRFTTSDVTNSLRTASSER